MFVLILRENQELNEERTLSEYACLSKNSKGRKENEPECDIRTCFQRDRDRIIHSKAFRRLKHKTQVFLSPEGDHYRTRLTHTLEVAQIARTISRALGLNEDLTEAISLGHDLGHTPFGHAGERALNIIDGSFTHYNQSVRVCETLEKDGLGLNLTAEVLDGIKCHTIGKEADTLEGRVVKFADRIAYINHDIDDAVRAGVIKEEDLPKDTCEFLGNNKSDRINTMVLSLIKNSGAEIKMDNYTFAMFNKLHTFLFDNVYRNPECKSEETKVDGIVKGLYDFYINNSELLPEDLKFIVKKEGVKRAVIDHIAGMTDGYAIKKYSDVYIPRSWEI